MVERVHTHDVPPHAHDEDEHDEATTTTPARTEATAPAALEVGPSPGGVAVRILLTVVGAVGMIAGAFLEWMDGVVGTDVTYRVFFSTDVDAGTQGLVTSAGFVILVLGALALLGLAFRSGWLTRLAGALGLVAMALFGITLYRADAILADVQVGAWMAALGSLVALVGGFFGSRPRLVATSAPV